MDVVPLELLALGRYRRDYLLRIEKIEVVQEARGGA